VIEGRPQRTQAGPGWSRGRNLALWFGVFAAPLAWTAQLVIGYAFAEVECSKGSGHWGFPSRTANIALSIAVLVVALSGGIAAYRSWRAAEEADEDVRGRLAFMGLSGVLASTLFLALIVFTGIGVGAQEPCHR
jgi:hypothetical protein